MTLPLNELFSKITILIPTINESTLPDVIDSVLAQAPECEIVLLGYGEVHQVANKFGVEFLDFHQQTRKTIALNKAMEVIEREWVVVLDADAIPESNWAEQMARAFEAGHPVFSGSVKILTGNFWIRVYNLSSFHEFSHTKEASYRKHLPAISLGFTKEFYKANGPFREDLNRSEDYEWTLRAYKRGEKLYFHPSAVIQHNAVNKNTFRSFIRYWYNSGYENWKVRNMYAEILHTPRLLRSRMAIFLLSPILALAPTFRIFSTSPTLAFQHLFYFPFIYIAKIAWCYGVMIQTDR